MEQQTKKQTAVEQFLDAIKNQISLSNEHLEMIESYASQAKEMEKEQIIDAFCEGRDNSVDYFAPSDSKLEEENYYKQKFEQD